MPKPTTASEWIEYIIIESEPSRSSEHMVRIDGNIAGPLPFSQRASPGAKVEVALFIRTLLPCLWCDPVFWEAVHEKSSVGWLTAMIAHKYSLRLPEMPGEIWADLVRDGELRNTFFAVLETQPWRLGSKSSDWELKAILDDFDEGDFKSVIHSYVCHPSQSHEALLADAFPRKRTLKALKSFATQLAKDAAACIRAKKESESLNHKAWDMVSTCRKAWERELPACKNAWKKKERPASPDVGKKMCVSDWVPLGPSSPDSPSIYEERRLANSQRLKLQPLKSKPSAKRKVWPEQEIGDLVQCALQIAY